MKKVKSSIEIILSIISFKENNIHMIYAPALDLFGYGKTKKEAKESFEITLDEFVRYTINKDTLIPELKRLGWDVSESKKKPKFIAPPLSHLLSDNKQFNEIFNKGEYHKYDQQVAIPAFA